jgi:hypothetical protein
MGYQPASTRTGKSLGLALALSMVLALVPTSFALATGRTIYVSTSGSDSAAGTSSAPLKTIQAAANQAGAGDTIVVAAGTYNERPNFSKSGSAGSPIVVQPASGASVTIAQGLTVSGSYYRVSGFAITPGSRDTSVQGQVQITGSNDVVDHVSQRDTYGTANSDVWNSAYLAGSNNTLSNINFSNCGDLVTEGTNDTIDGGTIAHTGGSMAVLEGSYNTLEHLTMHDTGNTTDGQIDTSGNGSDCININGQHITIRGNKIYNVFIHSSNQHEDSIQWWNSADDLVIENNQIGSRAVGGPYTSGDAGHIQFETDYTGHSAERVTIKNNVFLGDMGGYVLRSSASQVIPAQTQNWQIIGNTFDTNLPIRGDITQNMPGLTIKDNIFTTAQDWQKPSGANFDYNAYVGCAVGSTDGSHSFSVSSAGWVNPDLSSKTAYGVNSDLHLTASSPLVGKGASLSSLTTDKDGKTRANPTSVGAYDEAGTGGSAGTGTDSSGGTATEPGTGATTPGTGAAGQSTSPKPAASVGKPSAPSSVKHNHSFKVSGRVSPAARTVVYAYRLEHGTWHQLSKVTASRSGGLYTAKLKLKLKGSWRIRAYHPGDSVARAAWSSYRSVRVK